MMLQIGVGYGPRTLRAPQAQPTQGLMLVVASDDAAVEVSAKSMVVEVAAPSAHAGTYPLSLTELARGPVCLALPTVTNTKGTLNVEPGLWAYDAARGTAAVTRQWLSNGTVVKGATGLSFVPTPGTIAQSIVLAETILQNGIETGASSKPHVLPAVTTPVEAAGLNVGGDARLSLVTDQAGAAKVQIIEPEAYAGSHAITAAQFKDGPLWLVPAKIEGTAQAGSELRVLYRGLAVGDADAGPVTVSGQWQRDGAVIAGAVAETYQVQATDAGHRIGFVETATDKRGTRRQLSNEIAIGGKQ